MDDASMREAPDRGDDRLIAIIGISARLPSAPSKEEFWRNQRAGKNCITEVPAGRWKWQDVLGDPIREHAKTDSKWGAFLTGLDQFDPLFFGISPFEAELMDPQHRLFVKSSWEAILDAGYDPAQLAGSDLGVFVGVQFQEYQQLLLNAGVIKAQVSTGNAKTMLPNRVSFLLDVNGPSVAIDTACSSSLVAIHHAVQALRTGSCSMALAGGANIMLVPDVHIMASQMRILSPTGQSRPFDVAADGYVRGEGVGALLLKPLRRAERDGDHVYAVIRGSAVSHGARSSSLAAPKAESQALVMTRAMADARVGFDSITYVEMHATGTTVGDPVEVEGVKRAFGASAGGARLPCGLGSVKSNIGHLEAAAGLAGVINTAMSIEERWLPGMSTFRQLNPKIDLTGTPFYIHHEGSPWVLPKKATRRAIVNSFGFGGANASIVLEEHHATPDEAGEAAAGEIVIPLSVSNAAHWASYCGDLKAAVASLWARTGESASLLDSIAHTLQHGRRSLPVRMAIKVSDLSQLIAALRSVKDGHPDETHVASSADAAERNGYPRHVCQWLAGQSEGPWEPLRSVRRVPLPAPPWNDKPYWCPAISPPSPEPITTAERPKYAERKAPPAPLGVEGRSAAIGGTREFVYLEPTWVETSSGDVSFPPTDDECVVILGEDNARLSELERAFRASVSPGSSVVTACCSMSRTSMEAADTPPVVVPTEAGIASWFERLASDGVRPTVMFVLGPRPTGPTGTIRALGAHASPVGLVFALARALMTRHFNKPITLYYVAGHAEGASPHEGALEAFAKSVYLENSRFVMNVLYPDDHGPHDHGGRIVDEWRRHRASIPQMVLHRDGRRFVRQLRATDGPASTTARARDEIRRGGTYLLAGGAGELGRRLAKQLASEHGANVVLLGRSAAGDAMQTVLDEIQSGAPPHAGVVIYRTCDVTKLADVEAVVEATTELFGGVHGVLSLVTDHRDAFLFNKSWDDFQAVSAGKVEGSINLDLATRDIDLDFFIVFSSQAALGMAGASDYAYGCEFQNQLAAWRDVEVFEGRRRGRSIAINWSRWQWDKYVTDEFDTWVRALGYEFLDLRTGFDELLRIMHQSPHAPPVRVFALYGDRAKIVANIDMRAGLLGAEANAQRRRRQRAVPKKDDVDEMLSRLSEEELSALASKLLDAEPSAEPPASPAAEHAVHAAKDTVRETPEYAEQTALPVGAGSGGESVESVLVAVLSRQLKIDSIGRTTEFTDLGVDSILAVELVIELENRLGIQMHPNWLFQFPTVAELADQIAMAIREGGGASAAADA